jgi:hypothetical protein
MKSFLSLAALGVLAASLAHAAATWCLGLGALGPIRTGMTAEQALRLADFAGMERRKPAEQCWYLRHQADGPDFDLMIIDSRVVRIELRGQSKLQTLSGAHIGSTEADLEAIYGGRLDIQPHKYDEKGKTMTFRTPDGALGLRFETSSGKVTAIQSGPWEHLNYVEGCG